MFYTLFDDVADPDSIVYHLLREFHVLQEELNEVTHVLRGAKL